MSEAASGRFEESLEELERIVRDLEDGQLGLDGALERYERGVALVRQCRGRLHEAELRILELVRVEGDDPVCAPFAHEATARNGARKKKS
jgi:exodeoxyribonuclease VII small subunit